MTSLHMHQPSLPPPSLNNDPALTHSTDWHCCPSFRTHGKECCIMYVGNTLGLSQHANMVLMLKKRQQENPCRSPQRQWLRYTRSYSTQSGSATYISMFDSGEYCLFFLACKPCCLLYRQLINTGSSFLWYPGFGTVLISNLSFFQAYW